jgi:hypothetical protein
MKKLKRELNVLSSNCKSLALIHSLLVVDDFDNLLKINSTTHKVSNKVSPAKKPVSN